MKKISKYYSYVIIYFAISDEDLLIKIMNISKMLAYNDHLNEQEIELIKNRCKEYQSFDDPQIETLVNDMVEFNSNVLIKDNDYYKATSFLSFLSFYKFSAILKNNELPSRDY